MSVKVANVALTDTFDTWRIRSNQGFTNLFANTQLNGSNTDITGDSLLITANTNVVGGTFLINGTAPGSDDTAIAFAIALG